MTPQIRGVTNNPIRQKEKEGPEEINWDRVTKQETMNLPWVEWMWFQGEKIWLETLLRPGRLALHVDLVAKVQKNKDPIVFMPEDQRDVLLHSDDPLVI